MMSSVPRTPIQFDRVFLDMVKSRLEEEKHQIGYQFDYDQDKPFREAAILMSCLAAALREVEEEISIPSNDVEVLGEYTPIPNKDGTMCVYPYIGFIRKPINDVSEIRYNPDEVSKVFSVPIEDLLNPEKRKHLVRFRDSKYMYPVCHVEEEGCTIWGLTAFIMDGALRRIMKQGPVGALICPEGANIPNYRPTP
ncbi:hypothetical protein BGZ80_007718 [Entomortierella chlamydospora]|uniref:Nudix hydrolase domain-containing protein n=1 Tax=Entomortierella chlamydospora TaxID=101097 RepID=A0A9P6T5U3_9FUNG|nr:hypothetical protein BGZ80_007718 [Entomortierella chlamydospora]